MAVHDEVSVLQRIASRLPYLPDALRQVADYVLAHPEAVQTMSITTLAAQARVADSTVSRFVREIGLDGYQSLRLAMAEAAFANRATGSTRTQGFVYDGIARTDGPEEVVAKIRYSSEMALAQTAERLDVDVLRKGVQAIGRASTIVFTCMGSSSIAAEEGVMRFTRAGKKCMLFRDQSIQAMAATILGEQDVVIAVSDSGRSMPVVDMVTTARSHGAATVAITSDPTSPLAKASEVSLFTSSVPSGGELYGEAVTSKWGQLLVMDSLYAAFAATHFDETVAHLQETYAAGIQRSRGS
ncbi:MurR/RpiR family transcriptional regulator [Mycolicibacterium komossense]|uniref:MurR/RpiR family transcriptional regulator n=1 Tax=Mycolicibacterium komossense TaxID=1779 RepID=A0ABT3CBA3_9MYCO|nr:MurR/RpiR family transcriptional regulator [Mycolicibacterium komossense]MCV7226716.1 MurR/RpiR family transcriptional regulator [Mycolicibacterium komossense]